MSVVPRVDGVSVPPLNVMFDGSNPLARSTVRTPRWVVGLGSCPAVMAALSESLYSLVELSYVYPKMENL